MILSDQIEIYLLSVFDDGILLDVPYTVTLYSTGPYTDKQTIG